MSIVTPEQESWLTLFRSGMNPQSAQRGNIVDQGQLFRASRPSAAQMAFDPQRYGVEHEEFATALQRQQDMSRATTGIAGIDALLHAGSPVTRANALSTTVKMLALARTDVAAQTAQDDAPLAGAVRTAG